MSLLGAEWVLYLLVLLSIVSIAVIFERIHFYKNASRGLLEFRKGIRAAATDGKWNEAIEAARARLSRSGSLAPDLEAEMALSLLTHEQASPAILNETAHDSVTRAKIQWEKNLSVLATIGNNAPFVGLFGTVLGIIKAFHDLSQQASAGVPTVTAGMAEALVSTAIGILVAIPAVAAFNFFQRRVKTATSEAEALKSFLIGKRVK